MANHPQSFGDRPESLLSRRRMLKASASGFGYLAFAGLAHEAAAQDAARRSQTRGEPEPQAASLPARAKRVIFLCMNGGPSHVDTFDYKPKLNKQSGETTSLGRDRGKAKLLGSPFKFAQHGESGLWISEVFPKLAKQADELCLIRSMHTDLPNHSQAFMQMHTGSFQFVRPSVGAWSLYGLGTENANLPGFVTLNPPTDNGGVRNYGSAFLPRHAKGPRWGATRSPGSTLPSSARTKNRARR